MSIISFYFPFFVIAFIIAYFLVPKKIQWYVTLIGSVIFYLFSGIKSFAVVIITAIFTYIVGLLLQKNNDDADKETENIEDREQKKLINNKFNKKNRILLVITIVTIIVLWLFLKIGINYYESLFVPLGISFYTLNIISYLVDVSRKKYECEKNLLKYLTYILFFPHIIQGPFSRYKILTQEIFKIHYFNYDRLIEGTRRILWGYFKKIVVADRIAIIVNNCLDNYQQFSGLSLFICLILYSIELYADFSGYMDIVLGICKIIDIESTENFNQPYFSRSIDEFWRRWHITLGTWFKDYIFFPISMNKKVQKFSKYMRSKYGKKAGKLTGAYIALLFVWTATGLWHNFSLNYLIWGYLNMIFIMLSMQFEDFNNLIKEKIHIDNSNTVYTIFTIVRTFIIVCFIRVFSIMPNLDSALDFIKRIFILDNNLSSLFENTGNVELFIILIGILAMFIVSYLKEKDKWNNVKDKCPMLLRNLGFALIIIALVLFAGGSNNLLGGFMYAKF